MIFWREESLYTVTLLQDQLIDLLATVGITLDKWSANHKELLHNLFDTTDADHIELTEAISTLGLLWTPTSDLFGFKVALPARSTTVTKRLILSEISRL